MSNAHQEKLVLLRQIEASCDTAIVSMKKLNSSLESVVEVGQGIDGIAECWKRVNESLVSSTSSQKKLSDANACQE